MLGDYHYWGLKLFKDTFRFGVEFSRVHVDTEPYLDRYILYIGGPTLRLHKFYRGDDDRAPHDHPWSFWTFPFTSYWEKVYSADGEYTRNFVKAFRLHYRPGTYRHIVIGTSKWAKVGEPPTPFWTFVATTDRNRKWGFWPTPDKFVYWREWDATESHTDRV